MKACDVKVEEEEEVGYAATPEAQRVGRDRPISIGRDARCAKWCNLHSVEHHQIDSDVKERRQ